MIAQRNPELAKKIVIDLCCSKEIGTKRNYVSLLKQWWVFNLEHGFDPFKPTINPEIAIFWMFDRAYRLGSANSHTSWSAALSWWVRSHHLKPVFYDNQYYRNCKRALIRLHLKSRKTRLPLQIKWIVNWIKKLNCVPETWNTIDLDTLTTVILLLLNYFTLSRPNELTFTDKTENKEWEIKTTGLKWSDIVFNENSVCKSDWFLTLRVKWFKNQIYYGEPKIVFMHVPCCSKGTACKSKCYLLDFYSMLKILRVRRYKLFTELNSKQNGTNSWRKRRNNLGIGHGLDEMHFDVK